MRRTPGGGSIGLARRQRYNRHVRPATADRALYFDRRASGLITASASPSSPPFPGGGGAVGSAERTLAVTTETKRAVLAAYDAAIEVDEYATLLARQMAAYIKRPLAQSAISDYYTLMRRFSALLDAATDDVRALHYKANQYAAIAGRYTRSSFLEIAIDYGDDTLQGLRVATDAGTELLAMIPPEQWPELKAEEFAGNAERIAEAGGRLIDDAPADLAFHLHKEVYRITGDHLLEPPKPPTLNESQRCVMQAVKELTSGDDEVWPVNREIASLAGFSEQQTKVTTGLLYKLGHLQKGSNGRGYRLAD